MRPIAAISRARRLAPLVVVAAALALPAQSGAVGFGTNLNRAPDNTTATCGNFLLPFYTFPSCSFTSVNLNTGESGLPPVGRGIVTQARVRVGPVTGPMQIVVEQALRRDNPGDPGHPIYACCQAINAGPVFTPRPNAITAARPRRRRGRAAARRSARSGSRARGRRRRDGGRGA